MLHKALKALNQDEYISILQMVILKRINIKTESKKSLFFNTLRYCISRGFEQDVVNEQLKILLEINTLD